ncbi:MAG: allophanate hydrolase [Flavobacteriaceae bacterium]|nr:allophanate hydrolase [Flavobacteriaceae bacterium]|tara:strand:+ start:15362 stop:16090 length:729 start_codon:yes stop_codon:yes gene_type:complete
MKQPSVHFFTPNSLLLKWEPQISTAIELEMYGFSKIIAESCSNDILEIVPSYHELAVYLTEKANIQDVATKIKNLVVNRNQAELKSLKQRTLTIPVCYEGNFAIDLETVANMHHMNPSEVIRLHTQPVYSVSFLGFLPGFPYVSGLPEKLHTPRRENPRTKIAKGSVGIGGKQTGVYPQESPGGWHIIGNSPLCFFDVQKSPAALLRAGDKILFTSVSIKQYEQIATEVKKGTYELDIKHDD